MLFPSIIRVIVGSFFAIPLGLMGIYLTSQYFKAQKQAKLTLTWPNTEGEIVTSWVKSKSGDHKGSYAIIKYAYTVMNKVYESDKLSTADALDMRTYSPRADAQRVANAYPRGTKVTVYYDPQNPAQAVLLRGLNSPTGQGLMVSVILVDILAVAAIGMTVYNLL